MATEGTQKINIVLCSKMTLNMYYNPWMWHGKKCTQVFQIYPIKKMHNYYQNYQFHLLDA